MEKNIKWNDSRDEIMDVIELVDNDNASKIPLICPICNTINAHIYMHRWENGRGTVWSWCSNCKACAHASRRQLPIWWENADFVDVSELTSHPIFLESKVHLIDAHVRQLLNKEH